MSSLSEALEPFVVSDERGPDERGLIAFLNDVTESPQRFLDDAARFFAAGYGFMHDEASKVWLPANMMDEMYGIGDEPDWRVRVEHELFGSAPDLVHHVPLDRFRFHVAATVLYCAKRCRTGHDPWQLIEAMRNTCTVEGQTALLPEEVRRHFGI